MKSIFTFESINQPKLWWGRYSRIPGKEPVFHVNTKGLITVQWYDREEGERLEAPIAASPAAKALGKALNITKSKYAGALGGGFAINEFGRVVCPIRNSRDLYFVGTVSGVPEFEDPRKPGSTFHFMPPTSSPTGARWLLPYVGMKFNLGVDDQIYFKQEDEDGSEILRPLAQDSELISRLRRVRPVGRVIRFIVNLHGAVFTKVEPDWHPTFVGFINNKRWFADVGF